MLDAFYAAATRASDPRSKFDTMTRSSRRRFPPMPRVRRSAGCTSTLGLIILVLLASACGRTQPGANRLPIIDMHLHAHSLSQYGGGMSNCANDQEIMWGSDQMVWPRAIEVAIDTIEAAPFLNAAQKRDIFYNNAARFLRFSTQEVAAHHRR